MKFQAVLAAAVLMSGPAFAEEIVVKMLNRGEAGAMVFEPALIQAQVGDTVKFEPTDKGHNAETLDGFLPEGVDMVLGKMNEEMVLEITAEGLYGIRCKPHYGLGMVAMISVGEATNLDAARAFKAPKKAKAKFDEMLANF